MPQDSFFFIIFIFIIFLLHPAGLKGGLLYVDFSIAPLHPPAPACSPLFLRKHKCTHSGTPFLSNLSSAKCIQGLLIFLSCYMVTAFFSSKQAKRKKKPRQKKEERTPRPWLYASSGHSEQLEQLLVSHLLAGSFEACCSPGGFPTRMSSGGSSSRCWCGHRGSVLLVVPKAGHWGLRKCSTRSVNVFRCQ